MRNTDYYYQSKKGLYSVVFFEYENGFFSALYGKKRRYRLHALKNIQSPGDIRRLELPYIPTERHELVALTSGFNIF